VAQSQIDESVRAACHYRSRHGIVILLARSSQPPQCDVFCFPYRTFPLLSLNAPLSTWDVLRLSPVVLLSPPPADCRLLKRIEIESPHCLLSVIPSLSRTDLVIRSLDELLSLLSFSACAFETTNPHCFPQYLDDDSWNLHSQSSAPSLSPYPFCHLTRVFPKKAYCGRRPHSFHKRLKLASSLFRPTSDV